MATTSPRAYRGSGNLLIEASGALPRAAAPTRELPRQLQLVSLGADHDLAAALQRAEEDPVDQRLLDLGVDEPGHGTRAEGLVVAMLGQPGAAGLGQLESHVLR